MKAQQYAEALYEAGRNTSDSEHEALVERLTTLVQQHGHAQLLPAILREYEKLERARVAENGVHVHVARPEDSEQQRERIQTDVRALVGDAREGSAEVHVDDTLIGGYVVEAAGQRIDRTHKRTLLELYRSIITNS